MEIAVAVNVPAWDAAVPDCVDLVRRAAHGALDACGVLEGEVSIVLADDPFVQALNRDYRDLDAPTNVLAFENGDAPATGGSPRLLGDVVIAHETTLAQAADGGITLSDHLCHLVVHGVLHLLGYDHDNDKAARKMETLEIAVLSGMGIASPYGDGSRKDD